MATFGSDPLFADKDNTRLGRFEHRLERIQRARLMRPSAVTHTTDVEQRSIEFGLAKTDGTVTVTVPADPTLVPPGWCVLFVTDADGPPSVAKWVRARPAPEPAPTRPPPPSEASRDGRLS